MEEDEEINEEEMIEFSANEYRETFQFTDLSGISDKELVDIMEGPCYDCGAQNNGYFLPVNDFIEEPKVRAFCGECYQFYS